MQRARRSSCVSKSLLYLLKGHLTLMQEFLRSGRLGKRVEKNKHYNYESAPSSMLVATYGSSPLQLGMFLFCPAQLFHRFYILQCFIYRSCQSIYSIDIHKGSRNQCSSNAIKTRILPCSIDGLGKKLSPPI